MKKILIALMVVLNCSIVMAQTEYDAFKVVQNDINGTARYMSMAGAFGALGGDPSAIKDNPAGLGIYRSSEFMGTMNFLTQSTLSKWNDAKGYGDLYKANMNNLSLVFASPTWRKESGTSGLMSSNFSLSYNRLKNINRSANIKSNATNSSLTDYMASFSAGIPEDDLSFVENSYDPFDNPSIPWISVLGYEGRLMDPDGVNNWVSLLEANEKTTPNYTISERGYVDEYSVGWAGNFSNIFYFGTTLNLQNFNYSLLSNYSESFEGGGKMNLRNEISSKGTGLNLKVGAIVSPVDFLRIGLAFQTPTIYAMSDTYDANLDYNTTDIGNIETLGGSSDYQIQSPIRINLSAAFLLGSKGLISAEYGYDRYGSSRFRNTDGEASEFLLENEGMKDVLNNVRTIKVGGEYRITENFSLRAGYANSNAAHNPNADKFMRDNSIRTDTEYFINNSINYITAGFGYHESNWFVDFAYMNRVVDESFSPYKSKDLLYVGNKASVITTNDNLVVSLGFKF